MVRGQWRTAVGHGHALLLVGTGEGAEQWTHPSITQCQQSAVDQQTVTLELLRQAAGVEK